MLKSANMFGLFLTASLIMLSTVAAAIPMGNMNLFSDAMASGKHSDRNYNYQEDEKNYYSDDDTKYSPDYNYYQYYQPMQQQEQQSASNNNNYGYDNDYKDKKISYDTSYEDMKTYSTYPTKDKKYVCQRGQFEGFYVESVEFCKLKIAAGPAGPAGPQGKQGIQGIQGPIGPNGTQGPPGPNQINQTLLYPIFGPIDGTTTAPGDIAVSSAICDIEDVALQGQFALLSGLDDSIGDIHFLRAGNTDIPHVYTTEIQTFNGSIQFVQSIAKCFDNPPLRP